MFHPALLWWHEDCLLNAQSSLSRTKGFNAVLKIYDSIHSQGLCDIQVVRMLLNAFVTFVIHSWYIHSPYNKVLIFSSPGAYFKSQRIKSHNSLMDWPNTKWNTYLTNGVNNIQSLMQPKRYIYVTSEAKALLNLLKYINSFYSNYQSRDQAKSQRLLWAKWLLNPI